MAETGSKFRPRIACSLIRILFDCHLRAVLELVETGKDYKFSGLEPFNRGYPAICAQLSDVLERYLILTNNVNEGLSAVALYGGVRNEDLILQRFNEQSHIYKLIRE